MLQNVSMSYTLVNIGDIRRPLLSKVLVHNADTKTGGDRLSRN